MSAEARSGLDAKRRAQGFGRLAETVAAVYLRCKGFRILARRFACAVGEIDIVAKRGRLVVIVEVKARGRADDTPYALGPHQRQRIVRAAQAFLQSRPGLAGHDVRFDVVLVAPWRRPVHLRGAFREDGL